jgi:hypothetical protein
MTYLTDTAARNAAPKVVAAGARPAGDFRTRTAALLAALARRVERGAEVRARRKASRMTAAEIARLPESVRMELGVNLPEARPPSPFVQGLVGPAAYWAPGSARPVRGDANR